MIKTMGSPRTIAQLAVHGVAWTGGSQVLRQVVQIGTQIGLARLLVPQDFGLLAMSLAIVGLAQLLVDFGIGAALVQASGVDDVTFSSCFWANIIAGGVLMGAVALVAPSASIFYGEPRVMTVLVVSSSGLLLASATVAPQSILYRAMNFGHVAKAQVAGTLVGAVVALALASGGFGVWSLVAQPLAGSGITLVLTFIYAHWRPRAVFSWRRVRSLAKFSGGALGSHVLNYAIRNGDDVLVGKFLGPMALGYYSLAYQVMLYPLSQVSSVFVRVLFPTLSRLKEDRARYHAAYLKSVATIALITFPMMMGLSATAEDLVMSLFGPQWRPALPVLQILAWLGLMQSIGTTVGSIYLSMGRTDLMFLFTLVATPLLVGSFVLGLQWGIVGVASAYAITSLALGYASCWAAFRLIGLRFRDFHAALARPFVTALMMYAVVWLFATWIRGLVMMPMGRLVLCIAVGGAVYAALSMALNRAAIAELIRLCRETFSLGSRPAAIVGHPDGM